MKFIGKCKWAIITLCIWAIILCLPTLRYHLKVAAKGSPWIRSTILPVQYGDNYSFAKMENPPLPIKVRQLQSNNLNITLTTTKGALAPLDKLIKQNPDLPWLIAVRLQATVGAYRDNRQGGEFSDSRSYAEIQKGKPSIEKTDDKVNFTPQEMQETLALCQKGEMLEPQNAYFTWMRVYFLMLNWQDKEAIEALGEAASKSYWNNPSTEYQQLYANAAANVLGRPLIPFETATIAAMNPIYFGNARMREMARILSWQGVKLKRAGKNEEAVELLANFHHAMTLAMQGDSDIINFLVAYAMSSMAASAPTYPQKDNNGNKISEERRIQGFIAYANKYHRPDLAQRIEKDWNTNHALLQEIKSYSKQHNYSYPSLTLIQIGAIFLQNTVLVIFSIVGALLGWILLTLRRRKSTFDGIATNGWDYCKGIFACSGIPSALLGTLILVLVIFLMETLNYFGSRVGWRTPYNFFRSIGDDYIYEVVSSFGNVANLDSYPAYWRIIVFITPLICGALFALVHSRDEQQKSTFRQKISRNIYLALLFLAWGIIALTSQYGLTQTILAAICGIFILFSIFRMWRQTKEKRDATFTILQSSLSGWVCTGSVLILILLIGQSITNHHLQYWADNQIRGEMHLLHDVQNMPPAKR